MEPSLSDYCGNTQYILNTVFFSSVLQKFTIFLVPVFIVLLIIRTSQKIFINILISDDEIKKSFLKSIRNKKNIYLDKLAFTSNICISILFAVLITSGCICLSFGLFPDIRIYIRLVLFVPAGFIIYCVFDFFSDIISSAIIRDSTRGGMLAWLFLFIVIIFEPFKKLFEKSIKDRKNIKSTALTISDLSEGFKSPETKTQEEQKKSLLKGIQSLSGLEVKEIMRARVDITAFHTQTSYEDILKESVESGYSRFPVYNDNLDNIVGILHIKDLFAVEDDKIQWQKYIRPALFVPENLKINNLLREFQIKKCHLAIVVDEYGGTSGIVTLEDILEEIVGEIQDEFDDAVDEILFERLSENEFIFDGKILLNDFCKIISYPFENLEDIKGDAETLAGLILNIKGKFPEKNNFIHFNIITFEIIAVDNRRIKKVKIYLNPKNK